MFLGILLYPSAIGNTVKTHRSSKDQNFGRRRPSAVILSKFWKGRTRSSDKAKADQRMTNDYQQNNKRVEKIIQDLKFQIEYSSKSEFGDMKLPAFDLNSIAQNGKIVAYFLLWYTLTVVYNICNKRVLNVLPLPAFVSFMQLLLGIPVFLPIWLFKPPPSIPWSSLSGISKIALVHGLGNLATVYSLASGQVSFTHIVKAAEPVFSAILSSIFLRSHFPVSVYLSLLPIIFGVALASAKEVSFSWFSLNMGMASNFFYQLRIVLAKKVLTDDDDKDKDKSKDRDNDAKSQLLPTSQGRVVPSSSSSETSIQNSPENLFRVLTIISALQLFPLVLLLEGKQLMTLSIQPWKDNEDAFLLFNLVMSGVTYYMYNEVAFWILGLVHPITHAVGNTIKRVVIIFMSVLLLQSQISIQGVIGSLIAIAGTFLYSLAQHRASDLSKKKSPSAF